jgi:hypothetical protein
MNLQQYDSKYDIINFSMIEDAKHGILSIYECKILWEQKERIFGVVLYTLSTRTIK